MLTKLDGTNISFGVTRAKVVDVLLDTMLAIDMQVKNKELDYIHHPGIGKQADIDEISL